MYIVLLLGALLHISHGQGSIDDVIKLSSVISTFCQAYNVKYVNLITIASKESQFDARSLPKLFHIFKLLSSSYVSVNPADFMNASQGNDLDRSLNVIFASDQGLGKYLRSLPRVSTLRPSYYVYLIRMSATISLLRETS